MASKLVANAETSLPIRVSVLEHGVQELKAGLDGHRGETRAAFTSLQVTMDRIMTEVAKRATPTNWFAVLGSVAATVAIVGAIFALAEWRVNTAFAPIDAFRQERGIILRDMQAQIHALQVQQAVLDIGGTHAVRVENDVRVRARIEAEQRALERIAQPKS